VVDERIARPTLIGRPAIIAQRIEKFGLRLKEGRTTTWSTSSTTTATATSGRPTTA
jgi:phosphotransacetylase